ncbi:hypothetical protein C7U60_12105 [Mesorhizobium plurifarium]|uniref:hypothetical protein n=1 Tax=Sinorhizobium arboris TaxID=76745 RepID=UPI000404C716|nr:hypothetical protein [Sinorhizobium arboris]PST21995.1 hypothetical protein C7U60_12105 [Mesorhizobium plurifarium]
MKDQSATPEAEAPDDATGMPAAKGEGSPLGSSFLGAVRADFARHGVDVIARIRDEKPETYLKFVASVLPKDLSAAAGGVEELSDEQLIDRIRALDAAIRPLIAAGKKGGGGRKRAPLRKA